MIRSVKLKWTKYKLMTILLWDQDTKPTTIHLISSSLNQGAYKANKNQIKQNKISQQKATCKTISSLLMLF